MFCISINDPEFLKLQENTNLDTKTLETYINEYYILTGQQDRFPTLAFINGKMGKYPYVEKPSLVETAQKVWNQKYSKELTFENSEKLGASFCKTKDKDGNSLDEYEVKIIIYPRLY